MSDDKPSPLQDVRKGLGLLFRAARTAVDRLPKGGVEEAVKTSAREVGRAIENVASTIERGVFGPKNPRERPPPGEPGDPTSPGAHGGGHDDPKPPDAA